MLNLHVGPDPGTYPKGVIIRINQAGPKQFPLLPASQPVAIDNVPLELFPVEFKPFFSYLAFGAATVHTDGAKTMTVLFDWDITINKPFGSRLTIVDFNDVLLALAYAHELTVDPIVSLSVGPEQDGRHTIHVNLFNYCPPQPNALELAFAKLRASRAVSFVQAHDPLRVVISFFAHGSGDRQTANNRNLQEVIQAFRIVPDIEILIAP